MRKRGPKSIDVAEVNRVVAELELPAAIYKTCPWEPRKLIDQGLRQWLRCAGAALAEDQVIGMPSHAVDEAWHGLILCTARYARFCEQAYGRFLHHHPEGGGLPGAAADHGSMDEQLGRTVVAWSVVGTPGEECVLWDLDREVGVERPWGLPRHRVAEIEERLSGGSATPAA